MPAPLHFPRLSSLSALASLFYFVWGELTRLSSSSSSLLCFLFSCAPFLYSYSNSNCPSRVPSLKPDPQHWPSRLLASHLQRSRKSPPDHTRTQEVLKSTLALIHRRKGGTHVKRGLCWNQPPLPRAINTEQRQRKRHYPLRTNSTLDWIYPKFPGRVSSIIGRNEKQRLYTQSPRSNIYNLPTVASRKLPAIPAAPLSWPELGAWCCSNWRHQTCWCAICDQPERESVVCPSARAARRNATHCNAH